MGHSVGDGIIVVAIAAAFVAHFYFKHLRRQRRLELLHAERVAAMEKGIPLPEFPIDPPAAPNPWARNVPIILGILLSAFGFGLMVALLLVAEVSMYWPLPLPVALMGLGLVLVDFLVSRRSS